MSTVMVSRASIFAVVMSAASNSYKQENMVKALRVTFKKKPPSTRVMLAQADQAGYSPSSSSSNAPPPVTSPVLSVENEEAETIEWSGPLRQKGTRSRMGKLMKALFPDQHSVKSLNDLVGKRCEVNLQENEKGFLQVVEVRPVEEPTKTKRRSGK